MKDDPHYPYVEFDGSLIPSEERISAYLTMLMAKRLLQQKQYPRGPYVNRYL